MDLRPYLDNAPFTMNEHASVQVIMRLKEQLSVTMQDSSNCCTFMSFLIVLLNSVDTVYSAH